MNSWTENLNAACAALPRTGLDRMDSVELMRRFDSKYVIPESWLSEFVSAMPRPFARSEWRLGFPYDNLYFERPSMISCTTICAGGPAA